MVTEEQRSASREPEFLIPKPLVIRKKEAVKTTELKRKN